MLSVILHEVVVKAVSVNLLSGSATVTLKVPLSKELMDQRGKMSWWASEERECRVGITPDDGQMGMFDPDEEKMPIKPPDLDQIAEDLVSELRDAGVESPVQAAANFVAAVNKAKRGDDDGI